MKITKRSDLPKCLQPFKQLKGICIGKCVNKKLNMADNHAAHAHCYGDGFRGWICLRYKYQLKQRLTLLHEMAHILANKSPKTPPHGKKWKDAVVKIGGTYKSYSYTHGNLISTYLDFTYRNNRI
jgi:hypothetical protein